MFIAIAIIAHLRVVVRAAHAVEPDVPIGAQTFDQVGLAVVVECLFKFLGIAHNVSDVQKMDLLLFAKMSNHPGQIIGHQREIALTKPNAIHRTRHEIDEFLVIFNVAHNARNPADGRKRWVIRMQGQLDIGLFGHRYHALQKILQIVPLLFFCDAPHVYFLLIERHPVDIVDRTCGRIPLCIHGVEIKPADMRPAARRDGPRRANHPQNRHPRIAPHGNPQLAHVPQQLADDLDLFVSPGQAHLDLLHRRARFNDLEGNASRLVFGLCLCQ